MVQPHEKRSHAIRVWAATAVLLPAVSTSALGLSIAWAPRLGPVPVAVASLSWFVAVTLALVSASRRAHSFTPAQWTLVAAAGLACLRLCSSGLIQWIDGRSTLFWNVDWRYAATQAHGIARFGGVQDSLDYAGTPVTYHVGPSWIAGALSDVLGLPVHWVLLVATPAACVSVVVLCGYQVLRHLGVGSTAAALSLTVVLTIPTDPYGLVRQAYGSLRGQKPLMLVLSDPEHWWFSPNIMLNSLFALALGAGAARLLVGNAATWQPVLGGATLASVMAVKPQYAVGFMAIIAPSLLLLWGLRHVSGRHTWGAAAGFVGVAALTAMTNPGAMTFTGVEITSWQEGGRALLRSESLLLASMAGVALLTAVHPSGTRRDRLRQVAMASIAGAAVLVIALESTTFLVDADLIAHARAVGLPLTPTSPDRELTQALTPVAMGIVAMAAAVVATHAAARKPRSAALVGTALVVLTLPLTVAPLTAPTGSAAYEVSEEPQLAELMSLVDVREGRWIANDLADPADNFARPLRATNLTSVGEAQFHLANVAYGGWTQDDVVPRTREVRRFFETGWSQWHRDFAAANDIVFVLLRDRCPQQWEPREAGRVLGTDGPWTLVRVGGSAAPAAPSAPVASDVGGPRYGISPCLGAAAPST